MKSLIVAIPKPSICDSRSLETVGNKVIPEYVLKPCKLLRVTLSIFLFYFILFFLSSDLSHCHYNCLKQLRGNFRNDDRISIPDYSLILKQRSFQSLIIILNLQVSKN